MISNGKLTKILDVYNQKLDAFFIDKHIKKKPPTVFETQLPTFVQILSLYLHCGARLEDALKQAIAYSEDDTLIKLSQTQISHVFAFHKYALAHPNDWTTRLNRAIFQNHHTGGLQLLSTIDRIYEDLYREKTQAFIKKSEQSSMALTFILMLSLLSVITVVISPILLIF